LAAASIREIDLKRRVVLAWRQEADSELVGLLRETAVAHPWTGRTGGRHARLDFAR
jgi:hypothetical protein